MSRAWRALLPELAAKAQQLLVLYNTRWVLARIGGVAVAKVGAAW
jgi:hypothetical protein